MIEKGVDEGKYVIANENIQQIIMPLLPYMLQYYYVISYLVNVIRYAYKCFKSILPTDILKYLHKNIVCKVKNDWSVVRT